MRCAAAVRAVRAVMAVAGLAAAALAGPLAAQQRWEVSFGAAGAHETVRSQAPGGTRELLRGLLFTGEAAATRRRFTLRLRYGQGRVTGDTGALAPRRVVEGEALVGYRARPWLTLWAGPHARTYLVDGFGDQRWLFWSVRATARGGLIAGRLETYGELWQALGGRLSQPANPAGGRGAEGGLRLQLPRQGLSARFAYRVEQGRVENERRETVEGIVLSIGFAPLR